MSVIISTSRCELFVDKLHFYASPETCVRVITIKQFQEPTCLHLFVVEKHPVIVSAKTCLCV
jgi:hypothetical protein